MAETDRGPGTTVSTHVLDSVSGRPAVGVVVALERLDGALWAAVGTGTTDGDGRIAASSLAPDGVGPGVHRLVFATGAWFSSVGRATFYPEVVVAFSVDAGRPHLHVPLLLAPYAYSTYRGS